jgi:hypothetical protein
VASASARGGLLGLHLLRLQAGSHQVQRARPQLPGGPLVVVGELAQHVRRLAGWQGGQRPRAELGQGRAAAVLQPQGGAGPILPYPTPLPC